MDLGSQPASLAVGSLSALSPGRRTKMPRSEMQGRVKLGEALAAVEASPKRLATLFRHGTLEVEFYSPKGTDPQTPHERDEVYVIARGSGAWVLFYGPKGGEPA
jgi:hypothetical protein